MKKRQNGEQKEKRVKRKLALALLSFVALANGLTACQTLEKSNGESTSISGTMEEESGGNGNSEYAEFSEIMQGIFSNGYYYSLISVDKDYVDAGLTPKSYKNPKYNAVPYGFLKKEGFKIDEIKLGDLYSKSDMYLEDNNLFIELRAEIKSSRNYLANYLLKYELTDQELTELTALFTSLSNTEKKTYYYAPFFIQELSNQRDPEVVSKAYITLDSIEASESYFRDKKLLTNTVSAIYLGTEVNDINWSHHTYQFHRNLANPYKESPIGQMEIAKITLDSYGFGCIEIDSNIVKINTNTLAYDFWDENKTAFEQSIKTVTYLTAENAKFEHLLDVPNWREILRGEK